MNRFLIRKLKRTQKKLEKEVFTNLKYSLSIAIIIVLLWGYAAVAIQRGGPPINYNHDLNPELDKTIIREVADTIWVLITAILVFSMNAGFAMLEAGFCRYKNTVNILSKNLIVFALSTLAFWLIGFAIMFGDGNGLMGWNGWFLGGSDNSPNTGISDDGFYEGVFDSLSWATIPLYAKFFFELMFAGIAATIISGAVAERIKFSAFIIFSLVLVGIIYPITGHWIWGGGWLQDNKFWDFAGSTQVHCVGGWSALVGAYLLGPRLDRYTRNDRGELEVRPIPAHNLSIATLGCFILWLGWFGFNPGSTLSAADPKAIAHIIVVTNTAAAMGMLGATFWFWYNHKKPDLSMMINGVLAGLVAITASCRYVSIVSAAIIGLIAGIIVVCAIDILQLKLKIDDPVGAIPVHLVCGIWGTLAVGLFSEGKSDLSSVGEGVKLCKALYCDAGPDKGLFLGGNSQQLGIQIIGILAVGFFVVGTTFLVWLSIDKTLGLRVTEEQERKGLDSSIHGFSAYRGFRDSETNNPTSIRDQEDPN